MAHLLFSFNVVMPVFIVITLGYLIKRLNLVNENFINTAIKFNFNVGLSTLIFKNIYVSDLSSEFNLKLVSFAFFCIIGSIVLLVIMVPIFVKDNRRKSAIIHTVYRSNFILFGIPLGINMFGESHIAPFAILLSVTIPTYNFFAVIILSIFEDTHSNNLNQKIKYTIITIFKNPLILGSLAAIIMQLIKLRLPNFLEKAVFDVASLGTPLALITLGAQFKFKTAHLNLKYSLMATFLRLVIVPLTLILIAIYVGFRGYDLGALFVLFSSPAAVSCYVMAKEMNSDHQLTGDIILISTLFSILTIFSGIYLLKTFSLI